MGKSISIKQLVGIFSEPWQSASLAQSDVIPFVKSLAEECTELLSEGKIGKAIDRISLGLVLNKSDFLSRLKKSGELRHSHYSGRRNPISGIAKHLLSFRQLFAFTSQEINYLESLQNLESYAI